MPYSGIPSVDRSAGKAGFTLIELCLTMLVTITILVTVGGLITSSQSAFTEMLGSNSAHQALRKVIERLSWELRFAQPGSITLAQPTDARSLTFLKVTGWSGSAAQTTALQTVSFNSGQVLLNGVNIGEGISDVVFNLNGQTLSILVAVQKSVVTGGTSKTYGKSSFVELHL